MNVAMPIVALALTGLFALNRPVAIMLGALALSPVPPILPKKLIKAGGGHAYVMSLLFMMSIIAIVWTPLAGGVLDPLVDADIAFPALPVAKLIVVTVLAPTLAGMVVRRVLPRLAERISGPLGSAATVLLLFGLLLIAVKAGPAMLALIGNSTLLAIGLFVVLGLLVGHLLGGPAPGDRTVLALASASRHPAVAMAIVNILFPEEKAVPAAVLLYLIVNMVVSLPYTRWRKKTIEGDIAPAAASSGG